MNTILSFLVAGAVAAAPHADQQPSQRITVGARVFYPGAKAPTAMQQRFTLGSAPAVWYVFTGKTLCETQTVSSEKPSFAANGWKVELKPGPANSGTLQAAWERLWVSGKPSSGGGTRSLTTSSGSPLVLDSIDGGSRLRHVEEIDRLKRVSPDDLQAIRALGIFFDQRTTRLEQQLDQAQAQRRNFIDVQKLGLANTAVITVDAQIAQLNKELKVLYAGFLSDRISWLQQNPSSDLSPVDGCDALSMSLQITAESSVLAEPTETEIWLVHKDPAGTETVQRQVVRMAATNGSYVFDDIVVKTEKGPITIEVYGSIETRTGADAWIALGVNRRYVAGGSGFTWKTKEGGTNFNQALRPNEVVAFNLLPLKDDEGVLVGHRFSVRVRTKILK